MVVVLGGCGKEEPTPGPAPEEPGAPLAEQVRVRHILVQYVGADGTGAPVTRSKASADSLIHALRERVLAGEISERWRGNSPTTLERRGRRDRAARAGRLPEFEQVARGVEVGQRPPRRSRARSASTSFSASVP
jgi:hypothetical protein